VLLGLDGAGLVGLVLGEVLEPLLDLSLEDEPEPDMAPEGELLEPDEDAAPDGEDDGEDDAPLEERSRDAPGPPALSQP
jgi:hypothetical protein